MSLGRRLERLVTVSEQRNFHSLKDDEELALFAAGKHVTYIVLRRSASTLLRMFLGCRESAA